MKIAVIGYSGAGKSAHCAAVPGENNGAEKRPRAETGEAVKRMCALRHLPGVIRIRCHSETSAHTGRGSLVAAGIWGIATAPLGPRNDSFLRAVFLL